MTILLIIIGVNLAAWCWLAGKAVTQKEHDDGAELHVPSPGMLQP